MDFNEFRARDLVRLDPAIEDLAHRVIGAAIEVHEHLGAGLPECVYRDALCHELTLRNIRFSREATVPIIYKGKEVGFTRLDLLVDDLLIVELKSVDALAPIHRDQCITYLNVTNLKLALLINFNVRFLKDGIKRVINTT
jgi:GxxExxY protein